MKMLLKSYRCLIVLWCGFILCWPKVSEGQKYDYTWLAGYGSNWAYDSNPQAGVSIFNFNEPEVTIIRDSLGINFNRTNSIISDSAGNLLFSTNGVRINNYADELIQNGDSLGWGAFLDWFDWPDMLFGQSFPQLLVTLPNPKLQNTFDLFYNYVDTNELFGAVSKRLLRAQVDMNENNGLGKVNFKDSIICEGNLTNFIVSAVKHANGRDWWILCAKAKSKCYNVILYDGNTNISSSVQCVNDSVLISNTASQRFSPDGNTLVVASNKGYIGVFNFDRCSGAMSLREEFTILEIADSLGWWPTGLEFSADSRFFYVFCQYRIFQFDMQTSPIPKSKDTIAKYDGFLGPFPQGYYYAQLAPNGKIYVNAGSTNYYIGVIDSPEGQGASCNFRDHGIELPTYISGLPYYPNYRLGALSGSACDTLTGLSDDQRTAKEKIIKVFPNPATDYAVIDYGFTDWNKGKISLQISNELGQVVYTQALPMYSGFQKIDVAKFAAGVYTVSIIRNTGVVATGKLVRE